MSLECVSHVHANAFVVCLAFVVYTLTIKEFNEVHPSLSSLFESTLSSASELMPASDQEEGHCCPSTAKMKEARTRMVVPNESMLPPI